MNCFDSFCSINKTGMYTREICNENTANCLPKCTHTLFICQEVFTFYLFTSFMLKDTNDQYRNSIQVIHSWYTTSVIQKSRIMKNHCQTNPFHAKVPFLYLLKTSKNLWFSDVFRGYRNGKLAWKGFTSFVLLVSFYNRKPEAF